MLPTLPNIHMEGPCTRMTANILIIWLANTEMVAVILVLAGMCAQKNFLCQVVVGAA